MSFVDLSNFYLDSGAVLQGQRGASSESSSQGTTATADTPASADQPAGGLFGGGMFSIVLIYAAIIGGFYFLSIRPQRKRQKQLEEMQLALKAGDEVVTSAGFYGKIVDVNPNNFVIEFGTNKGVRIPVRKTDVFAVKDSSGGGKEETKKSE